MKDKRIRQRVISFVTAIRSSTTCIPTNLQLRGISPNNHKGALDVGRVERLWIGLSVNQV